MARTKGAKDKSPRKQRQRLYRNLAIAGGLAALGGGGIAVVPKVLKSRQAARSLKLATASADPMAKKFQREVVERQTEDLLKSFDLPYARPASGYKGLSRAEKTKKVRRRQAMIQRNGDQAIRSVDDMMGFPNTGGVRKGEIYNRKPPRGANKGRSKERSTWAKTYAIQARQKYGARYQDGHELTYFARTKGAKDKLPRAKRTQYGPPGLTGQKASSRVKATLTAGALSGGLTALGARYGDGFSVARSGKLGLLVGGAATGIVGGLHTIAHLRSPRSPVKRWRKKAQAKSYAIADARVQAKARRLQARGGVQ